MARRTRIPSPGGGGSPPKAARWGDNGGKKDRQLPQSNRTPPSRQHDEGRGDLWRHIKTIETEGTHFRRQVPLGPYVVDFACMAARLVIEIDGSQHGDEPNKGCDDARTRRLESEGYRVIRFWNNDIVQNAEGVLDVIYAALYGSRDIEPRPLKHERRQRHPTPARSARRLSPSRGG